MPLAPIALFVYNRPEHTRRTLKFLAANELADESRLFVFSDGPKDEKDRALVQEVRDLVQQTTGFRSVELISRETNLGLADSIIAGVTRMVDEYGKVIVFEDDLLSSTHTLAYFNAALRLYAEEEKVMHIGAYMYPLPGNRLPQTFFYRAASSWGWATWKRAWQQFNPDIDSLMKQFDREKIRRFSIDGRMNFWKQMKEFKRGRNNSWAIRWYASIFLRDGLTLNPSKSLINNIGHDGSGVHSGVSEIYNVHIHPEPVTWFPSKIEENPAAYEAIRNFLKNRKGNMLQRVRRYVNQLLVKRKSQS